MADHDLPARFHSIAGSLPEAGHLKPDAPHPFETVQPVLSGYADNGGVRVWYAVWGDNGP